MLCAKIQDFIKGNERNYLRKIQCNECPTLTSAISGDGNKIKSHYTIIPRLSGIQLTLLFLTHLS